MCLAKGGIKLTLIASRHPTPANSTKRIVASKIVRVRLVLARRFTRDLEGDPLGSVIVLKATYLAIAKVGDLRNQLDKETELVCSAGERQ